MSEVTLVKVARLQREFCTKDFFSSHEFSYEKCSEIFPEMFEPLFCGSEKIPGKFPPNFPLNFPNFPAKNQKKIHRRASAGAQGETLEQLPSVPSTFLNNQVSVAQHGPLNRISQISEKHRPREPRNLTYDLLNFCGSRTLSSCSKLSLFSLKTCTPVKATP